MKDRVPTRSTSCRRLQIENRIKTLTPPPLRTYFGRPPTEPARRGEV